MNSTRHHALYETGSPSARLRQKILRDLSEKTRRRRNARLSREWIRERRRTVANSIDLREQKPKSRSKFRDNRIMFSTAKNSRSILFRNRSTLTTQWGLREILGRDRSPEFGDFRFVPSQRLSTWSLNKSECFSVLPPPSRTRRAI